MDSKVDLSELSSFFLVTIWDEALGPKVLLEYPPAEEVSHSLPDYNPLGFATQIFMVASSLFGSQEYQKEVVDLPVVTLKIRVRVVFDYKEVSETDVRGGRLPYMLIIGYPQNSEYKIILDKFQPDFVKYLEKLIKGEQNNFSLEEFWNKISNARVNEFTTNDGFFENIKHFSSGILFGMITGTVLRNNITALQMNFEKYLKTLIQQSYESQKLGQIFIEEYQEYFYCFWIGPFAFLLKPPLKHLKELNKLLSDITQSLVDHLWSLTLVDPHTETINLLTNFETNPILVGNLYNLAFMNITRKLSGLPTLGVDKQLANPEIIYYLQLQAWESIQILDQQSNARNFINYFLELKNLYLETQWTGILSAIGYFIGDYRVKKTYSGKNFTVNTVLEQIYSYFIDSEITILGENKWLIKYCPLMQLDRNLGFFSFLRSYLAAIFPKYIFKFEFLSGDDYSFKLEKI